MGFPHHQQLASALLGFRSGGVLRRAWFGMLVGICSTVSLGANNPFDFPEAMIEISPADARELKFAAGEKIVDFAIAPNRPEAAVIVQGNKTQQKLVYWRFGKNGGAASVASVELPSEYQLSEVEWHPQGQSVFLLGVVSGQHEIQTSPAPEWKPTLLYRTKRPLQGLVAAPRPFEVGSEDSAKGAAVNYRIFFGVKRPDGKFSTHSITDSGEREYAVFDVRSGVFTFPSAPAQPNVIKTKSSLPVAFHPAGHALLWEDDKKCFQKVLYKAGTWGATSLAIETTQICGGSVSYTPNGVALMHWIPKSEGVTLRFRRGENPVVLAKPFKFLSAPILTADGRGVVGGTIDDGVEVLRYLPVEIPLADVVNAWMFLESPQDGKLLTENSGLFRPTKQNGIIELFDSESYLCGGYSSSTPTRPFMITTDIFWDLYGAAYEGIFILSERQSAIPKFWYFVQRVAQTLKKTHPGSKMERLFASLLLVKSGTYLAGDESGKIAKADGNVKSLITGELFPFGKLKPRGHYAADSLSQSYFRASRYLSLIELKDDDVAVLKSLPPEILSSALTWLRVNRLFMPPSKVPVLWGGSAAAPRYSVATKSATATDAANPTATRAWLTPQPWGVDQEILNHSMDAARPSGMDIAAVLGSRVADVILEESGEYKSFPDLRGQISELKKRLSEFSTVTKNEDNLYMRWISGLALQWADDASAFPDWIGKGIGSRKRLQTGLGSWATLKIAGSQDKVASKKNRETADCVEPGFEPVILRPPRGFVEPDPKTFEAIAGLFDSTIVWIKSNGRLWKDIGIRSDGESAPRVQDSLLRRLIESRDKLRTFRDIAIKEVSGEALSAVDYEEILSVGRALQKSFVLFSQVAHPSGVSQTSKPDGLFTEVARQTAAGGSGQALFAGLGSPLEWNQIIPFFGRRQIVKGATYAYYERKTEKGMTEKDWTGVLKTRPEWIAPYVSGSPLASPAKLP